MLRQSGALAQRLLCGGLLQTEASSNRLLCNAMMLSTKSGASATEAQVEAAAALKPLVPQLSAAAAAALAAKRSIVGLGATSGLSAVARPFSTSAAVRAAMPAAGEAAAATAAGAKAAGDRFATLRKALKAVAAAVAALALTAAPALADSPEAWQWLFQDSASSTAQAMFDLHHDIMFFVITIVVAVFYMMFQFVTKFHYSRIIKPEKLTHHTTAEVIWTVIPTLIVLTIGIPSLTLIYSLDQHTERPGLTVKVIGRQWYWSYEMHDHLQHKLLDPDRLVGLAEKSILKA